MDGIVRAGSRGRAEALMPESPWDLERHFGARWQSHRSCCAQCRGETRDIEAMVRERQQTSRCPQGDSLYSAWQHWGQQARRAPGKRA